MLTLSLNGLIELFKFLSNEISSFILSDKIICAFSEGIVKLVLITSSALLIPEISPIENKKATIFFHIFTPTLSTYYYLFIIYFNINIVPDRLSIFYEKVIVKIRATYDIVLIDHR